MDNIGYCKFCGQSYMLEDDGEEHTQSYLNELATEKCNCYEAGRYAWRQRVMETYGQDLHMIFQDDDKDLIDLLKKAGEKIAEDKINSCTLKVSDTKTIRVSLKNHGLCLKVTDKKTMENISHE